MRLVVGPIPRSEAFNAEDKGWTRLREPASGVFAVQAILLSLLFLAPALAILPGLKGYLRSQPAALAALVSFFVLMVPLHEAVHALAYPGGLFSRHLVMGAWIRRGMCYVVYDAPVWRNRVLAMLAAPLVVISSLLAAAAAFAPADWRMMVLLALLVHTAICSGDFITFARLLRQAPANSVVQNDGWATYWKPSPCA